MDQLTYNDLVRRFGSNQAFDLLLTIEKLARIKDYITHMDEETRLKRALEALNNVNLAVQTLEEYISDVPSTLRTN